MKHIGAVGLVLGILTFPCYAMIMPISSVEAGKNGSPPYWLQSVTVGDYTLTVEQLVTGTSTGDAGQGTDISYADDFDLNNFAAGTDNSDPVWQITRLGGQSVWINTNGDEPDFFVYEVGMNDDFTVQAILCGGYLGQEVAVSQDLWGDTGLDRVGSPNADQDIGGIAFAITDLLDMIGEPLSNGIPIVGIQINSRTIDPANFSAIAIPEPCTVILLALGACSLRFYRSRSKTSY
ncbi:hypothetical protein ACFL6U_01630 [Planctomycetota bacterium]